MQYPVETRGGCLGEAFEGKRLVADTEAEIRPLDLVQIAIRPGGGPWARFMRACGEDFTGAVKLFLGWVDEDGGLAMVGQLVPPVVGLIPRDEIDTMHRIVGAVGGLSMDDADTDAFKLTTAFRKAGSISPIGGAPLKETA